MKIKSIKKIKFNGFVYNISTQIYHNYFANNMLVHNCHEGSTSDGKHGNINQKFFDTLVPGTELALGGGDISKHPEFHKLLCNLKERGIVANVTLHQNSFKQVADTIMKYMDEKLIYGLGVSITGEELTVKHPNMVLHTINRIHSFDTIKKYADMGHKKVLILGYKDLRRGTTYKNSFTGKNSDMYNSKGLYDDVHKLFELFDVVSFDNLALEQLNVRRFLTDEQWEEFYMGDDGTFTMYIDLVKQEFASSSTSLVRYPLTDNIRDMFNIVRSEKEGK